MIRGSCTASLLRHLQYTVVQGQTRRGVANCSAGRKYLFDIGTGLWSSGSVKWFTAVYGSRHIEFDEIFGDQNWLGALCIDSKQDAGPRHAVDYHRRASQLMFGLVQAGKLQRFLLENIGEKFLHYCTANCIGTTYQQLLMLGAPTIHGTS